MYIYIRRISCSGPQADMPLPSYRNQYMAAARRNGNNSEPAPRDSFHRFFECWLSEQNQHLQSLLSAAASSSNLHSDSQLRHIIDQVTRHYEEYYQVKSRSAKQDILSMLSPPWRSSLEDAFLWIGGWRPAMAFHLLYSKSGLQLEAGLADLINGFTTGDLGDLSSSQLVRIDELQRSTLGEEKSLTEKMAKQQEKVADSTMVELSQAACEVLQQEGGGGGGGGDRASELEGRVEETLKSKEERLEEILERADDLRLRTLKGILEILSPSQAVHFLIAAAELHLKFHEWGKKRDEGGGAHHNSQHIS